jgi:hypothetical protein
MLISSSRWKNKINKRGKRGKAKGMTGTTGTIRRNEEKRNRGRKRGKL